MPASTSHEFPDAFVPRPDLPRTRLGKKMPVAASVIAFMALMSHGAAHSAAEQQHDSATPSTVLRIESDAPLSRESEPFANARQSLPPAFHIYETARYVVLSDADPGWTREQIQRLERTHHQFQRFAHRLDLDPQPLRHKLVCVLFAERQDYQQFAQQHDDVRNPWIAGYYAPASDRVVFYRGESNPSVVAARVRLIEMEMNVEALERDAVEAQRHGQSDQAFALRKHRERYQQHLSKERQRVDSFTEQINSATTVHEAVHQLLFHTGVQNARVQYPIWICEGLATAFETDNDHGAFGPDCEFQPRREEFERLLAADNLLPLDALITIARIAEEDDAMVHRVYHQSYALLGWMQRFRADELRRFLDLMRDSPDGTMTDADRHAAFAQAFGDIERLERTWLRYERNR